MARVSTEPSSSTGMRWLVMPEETGSPSPPPTPKVAGVAVPTFSTSAAPTPARISGAARGRSRTFAPGRPAIFGTSPMFSVTVMCGKRPVAWMA